ncbi:MAG TPA: ATP-dependent DNA helicase [Actinomycetota bacterium]|jgi:DNA helicase-2/ATP-dependent DNA helicase PcrA|nr:ATP-dependent DNA helicase [Actinomycetota bacterium]
MRTASEAIKAALHGYEPSAEQWAAIEAPLEPVVIRAGAGSGKTAVMTARIVHLVETNQVRPAGVLGLTFTNKAAGELEERLSEALAAIQPHPHEHPTVMTYHAFAQKLVREHGPRIGVDPEAGLLSNAQKWQILMGMIDEIEILDDVELRHPLSFIPQTLDLADQCATHLVTPDELSAECESLLTQNLADDYAIQATKKRKDFAKIIRLYLDRKRQLRRIDYGDQIRLAVQVLTTHPDVAAELRNRYPVVLLDEYQDTDPAQKVMLRELCPEGSAVTAVGDARQAIYAWRGASMFNLINFHREFPRAGGLDARQATLSENFRSGRRIVELANRVIHSIPEEHRPGDELMPVASKGEGWVGAAVFADQEAEAAYIATEINRLAGAGGPGASPGTTGYEWKEMAILVRSRRYLDAVLAALDERDIPFEMPDLGGLLKVPAVTDVVAWLQILADPKAATNRWVARVLMGPRFRIHYGDLAPIAKWAAARNYELSSEARELLGIEEPDPGEVAFSLMEALSHADEIDGVSDEARLRIKEFLALYEELRAFVPNGLEQLAQAVADRSGVADALAASPSRSAPAMRENLNGFIGIASEFSPLEGDANLATFLDFLDVAEESEDPIPLAVTTTSNSVKVLTIHKAKGLEFDVVFVPYVAASQEWSRYDKGVKMYSVFPDVRLSNPLTSTKQLPPGVRKDRDDLPQFVPGKMRAFRDALKLRAEQDERRLFYVGVTRARSRLYCTAAHWYASEETAKGPSVFLDELLDESNSDLVDVIPGHLDAPAEETNPVVESMRERLVWPPPAFDDRAHPWIERLDAILDGRKSAEDVLASQDARALFAEHVTVIEALEAERAEEPPLRERRSLPATSAVRIAEGTSSLDDVLHPLPQRPTTAQRLGTEVHAWIEELHRGLVGLAEEEALDDASLPPDPETVELLKRNFLAQGYHERTPYLLASGEPATELPFTLKIGNDLVRGRIDAVYAHPDGTIEIVDFKTGGVPETGFGQLELYAEALNVLGIVTGEVKLTYAYLRTGAEESRLYTPRGLGWLQGAFARESGA